MDFAKNIEEYINSEISTLSILELKPLERALQILLQAWSNDGFLYIFGNGGSATTASHIQNDFNKGVSANLEKKFRFLCLNDNISTLTAIANDISYDDIFRFQLEGRLQPGDVVIAISGSGKSKNVINAVEYARTIGSKVIGMTGYDGGTLRKMADISIHVPVNNMQITEDVHLILAHLMMTLVHRHLLGKEHIF